MVTLAHSQSLSIEAVLAVVNGTPVSLAPETHQLLQTRRAQVVAAVNQSGLPAYGFNRGFGHNVDRAAPAHELAQLQKNFMRSHSCGVGPAAQKEVVRATMLLRAQSLARGHSGVRPEVIEALLAFLNHDITPVVPMYGSVGASGDLAPLSHIGLALIGEGECFVKDAPKAIPTAEALKKAGLSALTLEMKEGLALSNGVQFSTACGVIAGAKLRELLKAEALATALTAQVMLASDAPFMAELHALRPHRGATVVARWIWDAMQNSPIRDAHRDPAVDSSLQDPYNLRCAAQILGSCYDLIEEACAVFETEANSATDNPLLLSDQKGEYTSIVSGGHFHGMPVAVKLYNLVQAATIMSSLANVRCSRYIDGARNKGLGNDLAWPELDAAGRAISSAMMIPEYVSAALSNALLGLSTPSHLFSISTNAGQEDHVSMSAGLAVRVLEMLPRVSEVIGIELAYATQAAAIRRHTKSIPSQELLLADPKLQSDLAVFSQALSKHLPSQRCKPTVRVFVEYELSEQATKLSPVSERILGLVGSVFPTVKVDRELSHELKRIASMVESGELVREAAQVTPFYEPPR
jgi:histidine ammonia-lyase